MATSETTKGIGNILADSQRHAEIREQRIRPNIREYTVGPGTLSNPLMPGWDKFKFDKSKIDLTPDLCNPLYHGKLPESGEPVRHHGFVDGPDLCD